MFAAALFIVAQRGNNSFINRTVYKTTPSTAYHIANNNNNKKTNTTKQQQKQNYSNN